MPPAASARKAAPKWRHDKTGRGLPALSQSNVAEFLILQRCKARATYRANIGSCATSDTICRPKKYLGRMGSLQNIAFPIDAPPSTCNVWPVMKAVSTDKREAIAAAISSGRLKRCIGTPAVHESDDTGPSVVATPAYLKRHGNPQVPADIATHQAVVYTQLGNSWTFRKHGTEASVAVSGRVRFTAAEGIRAAVRADMGLAVTSDWMFWLELLNGEVVRVLKDWKLPDIDLWAVFPTGRLASAKARAFADFVEHILID